MNVIFDLDGTLIDSSDRMYQLFQRLVPESQFSKDDYWGLKRNKISHQEILERFFPNYIFENFNKMWLSLIEQQEYLNMDCNYPDTIAVLERIKEHADIILLTARQFPDNLYEELGRLKLDSYFDSILVTEAKITKESLLKEAKIEKHENDLFVSDMGKDIIVGKKFGYYTIGITHGFMSKEKLLEYRPDNVINDLNEIMEYLLH